MQTSLILERLYRFPARKLREGGPLRRLLRKLASWVQRNTTGVTLGGLVFAIWLVGHIYYFNLLVDLESNVDTARAQIDVAMQKRNHVQRSLTQLLRYHASYERDLLKEVTTLRTANEGANKASPAAGGALRIDAVGEQYPQLLLNTSVRQFSENIVASEADIAKRIAAYNDAVNIYTNVVHQFPGNLFARFLGYRDRDYFAPEDPAVLQYKEVAP